MKALDAQMQRLHNNDSTLTTLDLSGADLAESADLVESAAQSLARALESNSALITLHLRASGLRGPHWPLRLRLCLAYPRAVAGAS